MLSKIKTPLKSLARDFRSHLRSGWHSFIRAKVTTKSFCETFLLPVWRQLWSWYFSIRHLFARADDWEDFSETRPLIEDHRDDDSDGYSTCSQPPVRSGVPVKPLDLRVHPLTGEAPTAPIVMQYVVSPYCALCRKEFRGHAVDYSDPQDPTPGLVDGRIVDWQQVMIAICPAKIGATQRYFAVKLDLTQTREDPFPPIGMKHDPRMLAKIKVAHDKVRNKKAAERNLREEAVAVHRSCRNMAASIFKNQSLHKLIWQFGQSTRYLARTQWTEAGWKGNLRNMAAYFDKANQNSELLSILVRLSRLPAEIENEIRDHIVSDVLSCIVNFVRTTVPLMQSMTEPHTPLDILFHPSNPYLSCTNTSIYETRLIKYFNLERAVREEAQVSEHAFGSSISTQGIEGMQVKLGDFGTGITALRFLYQDGSVSNWLGSYFDRWLDEYITILGRDITGLRIHQDHFKITKIELIAKRSWHAYQREYLTQIESPLYPRKRSYMLSKNTAPSLLPFSTWRDKDQKSRRKRNFQTWQAGAHVSLVQGLNYHRGLTVYCLPSSICGIEFYDSKIMQREMLGFANPAAVTVYFELDDNERWKHVLVDLDASKELGSWGQNYCPPFIITTTKSRAIMCSPMKSTPRTGPRRFSQITDVKDWTLTGLFTDGTSNPDGSLRNLGVTYHIRSNPFADYPDYSSTPETPNEDEVSIPIPDNGALPEGWSTGFISVASLDGVDEIRMKQRGDRVFGLKIFRNDQENFEILGQYNPTFIEDYTIIYEKPVHGELLELRLEYATKEDIGWAKQRSEHISAVYIRGGTKEHGTVIKEAKSLTWTPESEFKQLAWLFNTNFDHVEPWNGNKEKIEVVPVKGKELMLGPGVDLPERAFESDLVLWDEHAYEGSDTDSEDEDEW